jgi:hypothetical protein
MANKKETIFQELTHVFDGGWNNPISSQHINTYNVGNPNDIIYSTHDKADYEKKKIELQQSKYLENRWIRSGVNLSVSAYAGLSNVKLMYRDSDLMDAFPEIGAALDIYAEESTIPGDNGQVINVYSKSDRIKSILEDLFVNRLNLQIMASMVIRALCKYGNQFMLLDIDKENGVKGWRQLPVFNVERLENGIVNPYGTGQSIALSNTDLDKADMKTKFVWEDENGSSQEPFYDWQVAHFRLIQNSMYLPYGCSILNSARRSWRALSLSEDMMLIYRLERSMERRVYKIYVGAIDDADVPAYVERIADNFKRTPIVDPMTGQLDLRKNILPVWKKTPIPLLDGRTITIEDLAKEYESGKENYVYSIQDKTLQIVPGKVAWCGKNYKADKLVKIILDDDSYSVMAPEHEILMRDGTKKRADKVKIGESIMPFKNEEVSIKDIQIMNGDDVYCMTVVGQNGEEDRHNFALRTFNEDESWNESGHFVSNCASDDIFIPTRDPNAPTPIDTLAGAQNLTAIDDIKYLQNKMLTCLRVPKTFLNFEEAAGDGKNLALMDIRFTRTVNRIQQSFLMELTKIAAIHLYILGFEDEITNFSLSMNNPSTQAEQLEIDNLEKKITTVRDAISDPGNGVPAMSQTRALKQIMKWSDKEIKENLEEIRLEKAIAAELEKTAQIIKRTGLFDTVDRIYGEPGAQYQEAAQSPDAGGGPGGGGGPMGGGGGGDFGGGLDSLGAPGGEEEGAVPGEEGAEPTGDMGAPEGGEGAPPPTPNESFRRGKKPLLNEKMVKKTLLNQNKKVDMLFENYFKTMKNTNDKSDEILFEHTDIYGKSSKVNEEMDDMLKKLDEIK